MENYPLYNDAGIGLRYPHYQQVLLEKPNIAWFEVHSENFFHLHSVAAEQLLAIRKDYPITMHGVALSLGSASGLSIKHLKQLKAAIKQYQPLFISEHLSWSQLNGKYTPDLLPLPYNEESLKNFCHNVKIAQDFLNRQLLIENPSTYLSFCEDEIPEWEFYAQLPKLTGCGLLFDVNNIVVNSYNHHFDVNQYLKAVCADDVYEIHLAGAKIKHYQGKSIMIDDHGHHISDKVWQLFAKTLQTFGNKATLIERDTNIPDLDELISEAKKAQDYLNHNKLQ